MATLHIDEEMVENTARNLNNAVDHDLVPKLTSLQNEVVTLLDSGMVLPASRAKLEDSYSAFNKSVTEAVTNIKQFALQYQKVKDNFLMTDKQIRDSMPS
ncbi:hypothetical protein [Streptomyces spongiae]|uniref:WXG100 family type VII secretion target n=1 Tax=Streptomyces spongiae TaxID=565072 RepID=A0A5N8XEH9_9ACTN|nr:hypothetical protein [Streptomyces spongiae]MPY57920.1 hypothetical protein [Streptomyces spongiae]